MSFCLFVFLMFGQFLVIFVLLIYGVLGVILLVMRLRLFVFSICMSVFFDVIVYVGLVLMLLVKVFMRLIMVFVGLLWVILIRLLFGEVLMCSLLLEMELRVLFGLVGIVSLQLERVLVRMRLMVVVVYFCWWCWWEVQDLFMVLVWFVVLVVVKWLMMVL